MPGLVVMGGPFAGKTTLAASLSAAQIRVAETDDIRRNLPGWTNDLWPAWWPKHPRHVRWQKFEREKTHIVHALYDAGYIVITHDKPSWASWDRIWLLDPGAEEIEARMEKEPHNQTRIDAAKHYWTQPFVEEARVNAYTLHGAEAATLAASLIARLPGVHGVPKMTITGRTY